MAADGHHNHLSGSPKDRWTEPVFVWISNSTYIYIDIIPSISLDYDSIFSISQVVHVSMNELWWPHCDVTGRMISLRGVFFHGLPEITGRCVAFLQADEWPNSNYVNHIHIIYIHIVYVLWVYEYSNPGLIESVNKQNNKHIKYIRWTAAKL